MQTKKAVYYGFFNKNFKKPKVICRKTRERKLKKDNAAKTVILTNIEKTEQEIIEK